MIEYTLFLHVHSCLVHPYPSPRPRDSAPHIWGRHESHLVIKFHVHSIIVETIDRYELQILLSHLVTTDVSFQSPSITNDHFLDSWGREDPYRRISRMHIVDLVIVKRL